MKAGFRGSLAYGPPFPPSLIRFRISNFGVRIPDYGSRLSGFGFRIRCLGFRDIRYWQILHPRSGLRVLPTSGPPSPPFFLSPILGRGVVIFMFWVSDCKSRVSGFPLLSGEGTPLNVQRTFKQKPGVESEPHRVLCPHFARQRVL